MIGDRGAVEEPLVVPVLTLMVWSDIGQCLKMQQTYPAYMLASQYLPTADAGDAVAVHGPLMRLGIERRTGELLSEEDVLGEGA